MTFCRLMTDLGLMIVDSAFLWITIIQAKTTKFFDFNFNQILSEATVIYLRGGLCVLFLFSWLFFCCIGLNNPKIIRIFRLLSCLY